MEYCPWGKRRTFRRIFSEFFPRDDAEKIHGARYEVQYPHERSRPCRVCIWRDERLSSRAATTHIATTNTDARYTRIYACVVHQCAPLLRLVQISRKEEIFAATSESRRRRRRRARETTTRFTIDRSSLDNNSDDCAGVYRY